jgi:hypothetical protein
MQDTIANVEAWGGYKDHVKRRHGIVHEGIEVSRHQAAASLEAARSDD